MNRRNFLKTTTATFLATALPNMASARSSNTKKPYLEYDKEVCHPLETLKDYKTKQPFEQETFVLAYFATPYKKYEGCDSDTIKIASAALNAEMMGTNTKIQPTIIVSPHQDGDPAPLFAESYLNPSHGFMTYQGLTGDREDVIAAAKDYHSAYQVDRNTGRITGHNRSAILIAPNGALLSKYGSNEFKNLEDHLVKDIKEYNSQSIKQSHDCAL